MKSQWAELCHDFCRAVEQERNEWQSNRALTTRDSVRSTHCHLDWLRRAGVVPIDAIFNTQLELVDQLLDDMRIENQTVRDFTLLQLSMGLANHMKAILMLASIEEEAHGSDAPVLGVGAGASHA